MRPVSKIRRHLAVQEDHILALLKTIPGRPNEGMPGTLLSLLHHVSSAFARGPRRGPRYRVSRHDDRKVWRHLPVLCGGGPGVAPAGPLGTGFPRYDDRKVWGAYRFCVVGVRVWPPPGPWVPGFPGTTIEKCGCACRFCVVCAEHRSRFLGFARNDMLGARSGI